jgi:uncharacterized repeat protein (TIGR03843 family)
VGAEILPHHGSPQIIGLGRHHPAAHPVGHALDEPFQEEHYFTLYADAPETHYELARIALFDYVTNNTDRKSGHVLRGEDGCVWGIDHGLCFPASFKLRTVIWDFADEPTPDALLEDIGPLAAAAPPDVAELLDVEEVTALERRGQRLLREGVLPVDRAGMRYPWPLV